MKLKNADFKIKADQLNFAGEQRDVGEEFRLMKQHTSLLQLNRPLVSLRKLEEHLSSHFSDRVYEP